MSLRDQPYLPLYVQDFLSDEKLAYCSAASTGVYIRLMCIMHKSEQYGKILLKQKFKQTSSKSSSKPQANIQANFKQTFKQIENFATQLASIMPYEFSIVFAALDELIENDVLAIDGDVLFQKRMVKDAEISVKRSLSGKEGGEKAAKLKQNVKQNKKFAKDFAIAKTQANTENEIEYENENENVIENENEKDFSLVLSFAENQNFPEKPPEFFEKPNEVPIVQELKSMYLATFPHYPFSVPDDSPPLLQLVYRIGRLKRVPDHEVLDKGRLIVKTEFQKVLDFVKSDTWFSGRSLSDLVKEWPRLINKMFSINEINPRVNGKKFSGKPVLETDGFADFGQL